MKRNHYFFFIRSVAKRKIGSKMKRKTKTKKLDPVWLHFASGAKSAHPISDGASISLKTPTATCRNLKN